MHSGSNDTYRILYFLLNTMKQWIKGFLYPQHFLYLFSHLLPRPFPCLFSISHIGDAKFLTSTPGVRQITRSISSSLSHINILRTTKSEHQPNQVEDPQSSCNSTKTLDVLPKSPHPTFLKVLCQRLKKNLLFDSSNDGAVEDGYVNSFLGAELHGHKTLKTVLETEGETWGQRQCHHIHSSCVRFYPTVKPIRTSTTATFTLQLLHPNSLLTSI
jgi:hypothetical protein